MTSPKRRGRRSYSDEYKADAVAMVTELGQSGREVAEGLGVHPTIVNRWVAEATGTQGSGSGSHRRSPDPDSDDVLEMRKEIERLRQENAFLKKAAAFFAQEHQ